MYYRFDISARLKEMRLAAKLTQEEFAEHSGISYKFYQHIESGRKKLLRIDTIERVCAAYDIALWQFFSTRVPKINLKMRANISSRPHKSGRGGVERST